ncbi:hypothetical protein J4206_03580 [Candidatus Woesearchaeota archaeon]|nr:hypothetical protein [Candidatus Woesearchaeota archaeon]
MNLKTIREEVLSALWAIFPPQEPRDEGDTARKEDISIALNILIDRIDTGLGHEQAEGILEEILKATPAKIDQHIQFCQESPREKLNHSSPYRFIMNYDGHFQYLELEGPKRDSIIYGFDHRYIHIKCKDVASAFAAYKAIASKLVRSFLESHEEYRAEIEASLEGIPTEHILVMSSVSKHANGVTKQGIVYGFIDGEYMLQIWAGKDESLRPVVEEGFPLARILGPGKDPEVEWNMIGCIAYGEACSVAAEGASSISGVFRKYDGVHFGRKHVDPRHSK